MRTSRPLTSPPTPAARALSCAARSAMANDAGLCPGVDSIPGRHHRGQRRPDAMTLLFGALISMSGLTLSLSAAMPLLARSNTPGRDFGK